MLMQFHWFGTRTQMSCRKPVLSSPPNRGGLGCQRLSEFVLLYRLRFGKLACYLTVPIATVRQPQLRSPPCVRITGRIDFCFGPCRHRLCKALFETPSFV